jgi:hypothetical protein
MAVPSTYTADNVTLLDWITKYARIHPQASSQGAYSSTSYAFISKEEADEYTQRYNDARIGLMTTGEQKGAGDRIYNLILMKRRMRAKLNKK